MVTTTRKDGQDQVDLWRRFIPFATQRRFLESQAKYRLLSSGYGGGKMLPLDEVVPTPAGWTTMGELVPGDVVFDHAGRPTAVTAVYDVETPERAWRLRFNDGATIDACEDHQWWTWDYAARKSYLRSRDPRPTHFDADWPAWRSGRGLGPRVLTTDEIARTLRFQPAQGYRLMPNHSIPTCGVLDLPEAALAVDPYLLGYWLGDGTSADGCFTCHPDDQPNLVRAIGRAGYEVTNRSHINTVGTRGLLVDLRRIGVLGNKHVPADYLRAGAAQRLELLRGLMDSDGCASGEGKSCVEFCSTTRALADAVFELAVSLGQKPVMAVGQATLYGRVIGPKYRVCWRPTIRVFALERKADRIDVDGVQSVRSRQRFIVDAERVAPVPMRCISVDSPHRTYLASRWMIPTHNSALGCRESMRHAVGFPGSVNLVARDTGTHLRDTTMRTFWREARVIGFKEGVHYTFNKQDREAVWWNGSTTLFRHFEDIEALGSFELSTAFIDEGAEVHDDIYTALFPGRLRAHLPGCGIGPQIQERIDKGLPYDDLNCGCPQRAWVCTNPGGSGYLRNVTLGKQSGWEWFPVGPAENPFNGPDYYRELAEKLKQRGEVWFKRLYEGSWDAFEGQRFTMFDRATHVLPSPFRPDHRYEVVEGWDFGHRETFVVWIAYEPRQEEPVVMFHELQVKEVDAPEDVANQVKRIRAEYGITQRVRALGDPAGAAASQFSSIGPIMAYANLGISIAPCRAGKDPRARADLMAHMFNIRRRQPDGSWWPGLVIGPNCPALIDSVMNLRWDEKSVREQFVKDNDHGFDAAGYGLLGVPPPTDDPPPRARVQVNRPPRAEDAMAPDDSGWVEAA